MSKIDIIDKPFKTYDEQITKLQEKGLNIISKEYSKKLLEKYSYFALISGYKKPFKDESTRNYKKKASIKDIYTLYTLDNALRALFLKNILIVESHIKSLISYSFCEKYGNNQESYLDRNSYTYIDGQNNKHNANIDTLISKLKSILSNNTQYSYLKHQKENYDNIPLWALMKAATLGLVASMYALLPQTLQINVSRPFSHIDEKMLVSMLDMLARVRNVCAHNERLYDYRYKKGSISNTILHKKLSISSKNGLYTKGKKDLFAIVIILKYLLSDVEFKTFYIELSSILENFYKETSLIQSSQMQKIMGFPDNWKDIEKL